MGRPDNGMGKAGEKSKGFGLSAEAIAKLRQVQDLRQVQYKISICSARLHVNWAASVISVQIQSWLGSSENEKCLIFYSN